MFHFIFFYLDTVEKKIFFFPYIFYSMVLYVFSNQNRSSARIATRC